MSSFIPEFEGVRTLRFYLTPNFEENWSELKALFFNLELNLENKQVLPYFKEDVIKFGIKKGVYLTEVNNEHWSTFKYLMSNNSFHFMEFFDLVKGRSTIGEFIKIKVDTNPFDHSVTKSLRVSPSYIQGDLSAVFDQFSGQFSKEDKSWIQDFLNSDFWVLML